MPHGERVRQESLRKFGSQARGRLSREVRHHAVDSPRMAFEVGTPGCCTLGTVLGDLTLGRVRFGGEGEEVESQGQAWHERAVLAQMFQYNRLIVAGTEFPFE